MDSVCTVAPIVDIVLAVLCAEISRSYLVPCCRQKSAEQINPAYFGLLGQSCFDNVHVGVRVVLVTDERINTMLETWITARVG